MNRTSLPVTAIVVEDRQRQNLGNIPELAESIRDHGLIQPIVVNQSNRLIAGGRRLAAVQSLGWSFIDVVYKETLSTAELYLLEAEENVKRLDLSWQERCLCIARVHEHHVLDSAKNGEKWLTNQSAEILNMSGANLRYNLQMAQWLRAVGKDDPLWQCDTFHSAYSIKMAEQQQVAQAELAKRQRQLANTAEEERKARVEATTVAELAASKDKLAVERARYEANPLNTIPFDTYWAERQRQVEESRNTIYLSNRYLNVDAIKFAQDKEPGWCDHIITDIPYAIDMEMLDQDQGGINTTTVAAEHDVTYNTDLITAFYPTAFRAVRNKGFVITWCDAFLFRWMHDLATEAGFAVQRWPFHWCKPSGPNQAAQYNMTKATEIAIVARKPGATLANKIPLNYVVCGKDDLCNTTSHPFAKPFAAWEPLIRAASFEGQLVWEPFAGGGSGVLSMLRLNRSVVATELNANHHVELVENVKKFYLTTNPKVVFK